MAKSEREAADEREKLQRRVKELEQGLGTENKKILTSSAEKSNTAMVQAVMDKQISFECKNLLEDAVLLSSVQPQQATAQKLAEIQEKHDLELKTLNELLVDSQAECVQLETRYKELEAQFEQRKALWQEHEQIQQNFQQRISDLEQQLQIEKANREMIASKNQELEQLTSARVLELEAENIKLKDTVRKNEQKYDCEISLLGEQHKKQQESFLNELMLHEQQFVTVNQQVDELTRQLNESQHASHQLRMLVNSQSEKLKIMEQQHVQFKKVKEELSLCDEEKDKIHRDLCSVTEDLLKMTNENIAQSDMICRMGAEIKRLESVIELYQRMQDSQYVARPGDAVDEALADFLRQSPVPVKFTRLEEGVYNFGSRRVLIKLQKGNLLCRVGGGYQHILEFLKLCTVAELYKMKHSGDLSQLAYPVSFDDTSVVTQNGAGNAQQNCRLSARLNTCAATFEDASSMRESFIGSTQLSSNEIFSCNTGANAHAARRAEEQLHTCLQEITQNSKMNLKSSWVSTQQGSSAGATITKNQNSFRKQSPIKITKPVLLKN